MNEENLNQRQLAKKIGVPYTTVNSWFSSNRIPDTINIIGLARFFDVSTDYLLGLEDYLGNKIQQSDTTVSAQWDGADKIIKSVSSDRNDEEQILIAWRKLSKEKKQNLLGLLGE